MGSISEGFDEPGLSTSVDSDVALLLATRHAIDITGYTDFPEGTWHEYFAVFALGHIGFATREDLEFQERTPLTEIQSHCWSEILGYRAVDAMEAVVVAEWLKREASFTTTLEEQVGKHSQQRISLQAQRAAIARNKKTTQLKQEFLAFRKSASQDISVAESARRFLANLDINRQKLLTPTNAVRTLCEAWTAYQKRHIP